MPLSPSRFLLVAHEASRSGAPILMLTFARWLKAHTTTPFDILLLADGPLRAEFAAVATTHVADELSGRSSSIGKVRNRMQRLDAAFWRTRALRQLGTDRYTVVYGNSIVCLPWIAAFKEAAPTIRCVCAVHELSWVIGEFFDRDYVARTLPRMDRIAAGSEAVQRNLMERFAVPAEQIDVIHSFVDTSGEAAGDAAALRREFNVQPSDFVVVAVGPAELRKGTDLAAPIVADLVARHPDRRVRFIWLGAREGDGFARMCKVDAEQLGVTERLTFVPGRPTANDFIALCDVFALPSREDPFPLVVLTAVRLGKPVIAFQHSGGMDELLADGAGRLVPYLDTRAFSDAIAELAIDSAARDAIVARARAKVAARYDAGELARRLHRALEPTASGAD